MKRKERKTKERPEHCIIGSDYAEEKCKGIECRFKVLCRKLRSIKVLS